MKTTLHASVQSFLAKPLPHSIGGKSYLTSSRAVINPSDGSILAEVSMGGPEEINKAVAVAETAFTPWSRLKANERAAWLHRFADGLERHAAEIAQLESLDVGKAIAAAAGFDVPFGIQCLRYFADLSMQVPSSVPLALRNIEARIWRVPHGVCGFIFPWNFPFTLLCWGIAPALAAGNTVVVKPSEETPLSTLFAARIAAEVGLPRGVFNVVMGDGINVGASLTSHPRIKRMSFTGSPAVGKKVGEVCGRNLVPCKLELGGKGAAIVFDDVDLDSAATQLAGAITLNTGQVCCTATRWIIHENIYDGFVSKVSDVLKQTKIGPGMDSTTQMGPLVSETQRKRVLGYLERGKSTGARAVLDGRQMSPAGAENGFYIEPTLLEGPDDNICCTEEIFGPCAYLLKFKNEEGAVAQVNQLNYGLANSVWSTDIKRANRVAEQMVAGNSWINAHNVFAYGLPYGGVNLSGLGGGVNSPETFHDYQRSQTIARPLN